MIKLRNLLLTGLLLTSIVTFGQDITYPDQNVITTAVPFLMISPDARAGGYGDAGAATSPDVFSMHWNPAKYAFAEQENGFGISYTPWLRNLVNDINLAYVGYFHKFNDLSAFGATLRYFTMGEIQFTDNDGNPTIIAKPNEFSVDATYARKLHQNLSLAVAGRFIYSNLTQGYGGQSGVETTAGIAVAADLALYWQKDVNWFSNMPATFAWGLNISNIGNKISYSKSNIKKDFIPTNFRLGPRLTIELDEYNEMSFFADVNKLLVPTPPIYKTDENGNPVPIPGGGYEIAAGMDNNVSPITGMIQSWYDAPQGFSEEMSEFNFSVGTEYWYNKLLALRGGLFLENKRKGNRKYATLGVGIRYNVFGLDFSYLIPMNSTQNPLQNTMRFSLVFDFGKKITNTGEAPK